MTDMDLIRVAAAIIVIAAIIASEWALISMFRQINGVDRVHRVSFPWTTPQRLRTIRLYRSLEPHGKLLHIFAGCIGTMVFTVFATLIVQGAHAR